MVARNYRIAVYHNLPSGGGKRGLHGFARELAVRGHSLDEYTLSSADRAYLPLGPYVGNQYVYPFDIITKFPLKIRGLGSFLDALTSARSLQRLDALSKRVAGEIDARRYDLVLINDCALALKPHLMRYISTRSAFYCHHAARGRDYAKGFGADREQAQTRLSIRARVYATPWKWYWSYFSAHESRSIRASKRLLTNSQYSQGELSAAFGKRARVLPYGIDSTEFQSRRQAKEDYILSVGALTAQKGYRFMVLAIAEIPSALRPHLLILANSVDERERTIVQQLASALNVVVDVRSARNHEDLLRCYSNARLFAYSSYHEAFGLAPLEAMACELPVVAVNEGGVTETVVDGVTGFLVGRDTAVFADAMTRLIVDPKLGRELGTNGRQHIIQNWSWEIAGARLENFIHDIISETIGAEAL